MIFLHLQLMITNYFGTGIPLALLLPNCKIVVVDLNRRSIDLLHDKAESVIKEIDSEIDRQKLYADFINPSSFENDYYNDHPSFQCCGGSIGNGDGYGDNNAKNNNTNNYKRKVLANLFTFYGPVEDYREKFDMAIGNFFSHHSLCRLRVFTSLINYEFTSLFFSSLTGAVIFKHFIFVEKLRMSVFGKQLVIKRRPSSLHRAALENFP